MKDNGGMPALSPRARRALWLALWATLAIALFALRGAALPFLLGLLGAYLFDPVVIALGRPRLGGRSLPRWGAVLVLFAAGAALVALLASWVFPHLDRELGRLAGTARDLAGNLNPDGLTKLADRISLWASENGLPIGAGLAVDPKGALASLSEAARAHLLELVGLGPTVAVAVVRGVFDGALTLMVTAFLLADPQAILGFAERLVPPVARPGYRRLLARVDVGLSGVVRGQLTICVINGTLTIIALLVLRVPFAYALALLATVSSFIPIFGTFLSSIPIVAVALGQGLHVGVLMLLCLVGIHNLEAYVLNPKVMGDASRLHPLLILFALVAGERTFGLLGAVFAVPAMSLASTLFLFALEALTGGASEPAQGPVGEPPAEAEPPRRYLAGG
ncbi:MAG: AI-2E family transporter [Deltaproteobacteria bacterium]